MDRLQRCLDGALGTKSVARQRAVKALATVCDQRIRRLTRPLRRPIRTAEIRNVVICHDGIRHSAVLFRALLVCVVCLLGTGGSLIYGQGACCFGVL
jgi:hypothetical protein